MRDIKELIIIILNYNSSKEIIRQLSTLTNKGEISNDSFIILDNNSNDGKELEAYCNTHQFFFHQMGNNLGYAYANNWAIKQAIEWGKKYFFILNPDIHIDAYTIEQLYLKLKSDPSLGVLGPRLLYHSNPDLIFSDGGLLYPKKGFEGNHINFLKNVKDAEPQGMTYDMAYINGSAMMFKKEVLDDMGYMEAGLFMYYEESEWCYRIKKSNRWKIAVDTELVAYQSDSSRGKVYEYYMTRNRIWLTKKYSGSLFFVIRERMIVARKKFFSSKGSFKENMSFSKNIFKGIIHGLIGKTGKL
ncbi:glycosyltransferase family 2 protein [Chryseobacterium tructae]|uniref:Glycosyltransferase n=1 Tax=Chryseobacterium tructae TaxID=1037380 RepID=A0ABV7XQS4_9FLAO|nr:glycosyltransferase family 2 protein [Chryseobacterium tructae]MDN3691082.1 glycosyltransferase family 2 protein [Chryseobacterium tructae]